MPTPRATGPYLGDDDYDDDDTISDISFDDAEEFYDRNDVIVADRTSSFSLTNRALFKSHRSTPDKFNKVDGRSSVDTANAGPEKQGTVRGVLIPCLQSNMLGAMIFMRLPWITSQTGVYLAALSFVLCLGSTLLTLLSLIAISTNGKIKKSGGLYVFVRKHLGLEMGGSIGLLHLIQKILTVSMHCLASSEAILRGFGVTKLMPHDIAVGAILICLSLSILVVLPTVDRRIDNLSLVFLIISALTVVSFVVGVIAFASGVWWGELSSEDRLYTDNISPNYADDESNISPSFFALLALYYASASGLMSASTRAGGWCAFVRLCVGVALDGCCGVDIMCSNGM